MQKKLIIIISLIDVFDLNSFEYVWIKFSTIMCYYFPKNKAFSLVVVMYSTLSSVQTIYNGRWINREKKNITTQPWCWWALKICCCCCCLFRFQTDWMITIIIIVVIKKKKKILVRFDASFILFILIISSCL